MKITSIKVMKRKNLGNYEHEEITMEAVLAEGESAEAATLNLKTLVEDALNGTLGSHAPVNGVAATAAVEEKVAETTTAATTPAPAPAARKPRAPKTTPATENKLENGQDIPPVIPTEAAPSENAGGTSSVAQSTDSKDGAGVQSSAPKASPSVAGKGIVNYDAGIKEHRSRFATFLGNTYPKWTPDAKFGKETQSPEKEAYKAAVQEFSKGLHGMPFEDAKGNMLDSFKAKLEEFFGAK